MSAPCPSRDQSMNISYLGLGVCLTSTSSYETWHPAAWTCAVHGQTDISAPRFNFSQWCLCSQVLSAVKKLVWTALIRFYKLIHMTPIWLDVDKKQSLYRSDQIIFLCCLEADTRAQYALTESGWWLAAVCPPAHLPVWLSRGRPQHRVYA